MRSPTNDLYEMLSNGEVDAVIGAPTNGSPEILPLFTNPESLDKDWYSQNQIYPKSKNILFYFTIICSWKIL